MGRGHYRGVLPGRLVRRRRGDVARSPISRRWLETVYLSAGAFIVYLVAKYSDWWWDVLPRWLFFLLLGLFALALLWVFRRLRRRLAGAR